MAIYTTLRLLACGFALFGAQEGSVRFAPGFPVAIPGTGCAVVVGTAKPDMGFNLHRAKVNYYINGCESRNAMALLYPDGSYIGIMPGLSRGKTYQVMVEIEIARKNEVETLVRVGSVVQK